MMNQLMEFSVFPTLSATKPIFDDLMGQSLWSMPFLQGIGVGGCRF
jgi:hypothetical protein